MKPEESISYKLRQQLKANQNKVNAPIRPPTPPPSEVPPPLEVKPGEPYIHVPLKERNKEIPDFKLDLPKLVHKGDTAIITCYFNMANYRRPLGNFQRFLWESASNYPVYAIELVLEGSKHFLPEAENTMLAETKSILWHKEQLLNLIKERVPSRYKKIAWVDCDMTFADNNWVNKVSDALEKYKVVQCFKKAVWLDQTGLPEKEFLSAGYAQASGKENWWHFGNWHPGFAWAARRDMWDKVGGLFPYSFSGSADSVMAYGFGGLSGGESVGYTIGGVFDKNGWKSPQWSEWSKKAKAYTTGKIGYADNLVLHNWHGDWKNRDYQKHKTMPVLDFSKDVFINEKGILEWNPACEHAEYFQKVFENRKEDGE